jgi:hypothetical protein
MKYGALHKFALPVLVACCIAAMPRHSTAQDAEPTANRFDIVARGLTFESPDRIRPGWIKFRMVNASGMAHFAVIERLPEGYGLREQQDQVAPVFQEGMDLLAMGDNEGANTAFGKLPAWFGDIVFTGGPGLTGPGVTSEVTMYLPPGEYLLECYVKTEGIFHSYNPEPDKDGMVRAFTVAGAPLPHGEPDANLSVAISSNHGFAITGKPSVGANTVKISFEDQKVYANFVEHDIHLVRLSDGVELGELEQWMDWRLKGGLQTPAPAVFLGGVNEMPAGSSAYLHVDLTPGRYTWIAEIPDSSQVGMLHTFEVR